jgi:hypothetical protein
MKRGSSLSYPPKFRALAQNILTLSGGYTNSPVQSSILQQKMGSNDKIKHLGFKSFSRMMKQAWNLGLIRGAYKGYPAILLMNLPDGHSTVVCEQSFSQKYYSHT